MQVLNTTCSFAYAESTSISIDMATYQGELTLQEVVKLIEVETDEGGDILEELTDQDIRGIYEQLSHEDKRRFRQFRKFHRQYFGVYGEHLPSYHMARQVVKDLMPVYHDKGTPPKKGGGSSYTVTKLPSPLEPKGQRPLSLPHSP